MREQLLLHEASTTEQPRPDRTNRHTEDLGGRFVRLVFYIHNNQRGAEWFRNLVQRIADRRPKVQAGKHLIMPVSSGGRVERPDRDGIDLGRIQLDRRPRPFARTQEHVAANGEQPAAAVAAGHVGMPGSKGPQESVLHDVVCIGLVARE